MKREKINCENVRDYSITTVLEQLGHFPTKTTEKEAWYLSPLRSEIQASFKVHKRLNRWYDFGLGKGGNLIDLLQQYWQVDISTVLERVGQLSGTVTMVPKLNRTEKQQIIQKEELEITRVTSVSHSALFRYGKSRGISERLIRRYAKQVHYRIKEQNRFALGFQNSKGGFELRSQYAKLSSRPKACSWGVHAQTSLLICEGWFDMLSLIALEKEKIYGFDWLVLNSTALLTKVREQLLGYGELNLYLDRDVAGRKATEYIQSVHPKVWDRSDFYKDFKDINDWWTHEERSHC